MSLTRHHQVITNHNTGGGGNIDALLEDLQKSVSRPGSSLGTLTNGYSNTNGNVVTTGFREFAKTIRTEKSGQPAETNKEYHIEYLNPANTTTVMAESKIPNFESFKNVEHQKHILPPEQNGLKSYKEVQKSYQYNSNAQKSQSHTVSAGSDVTLKSNINELDSLLNDLNQAQRTGYHVDTVDYRANGIDSGLIEPFSTSTPNRSGHVSRIEKKTFEEHRSHRVGDTAPSKTSDYRKELVFTGGSKDPSPMRQQVKDEYYYESRSSTGKSARDKSPPQDRVIYPPSNPTSPTLGRRGVGSPSPARYYTSTSTVRESSSTPPPRVGVNQKVSSFESYHSDTSTSSTTRQPATRHPPVKTPPPYRSPSPIAFAKQPDPNVNFGGKPLSPGLSRKFGSDQTKTIEKSSITRDKYNSLDREKSPPTTSSNYNSTERNHTIDKYTSGYSPDKYPSNKYYTPETLTNVEESYTTSKIDQGNPTVTHFPGGKIVEYRYKEESTTSTKYPPTITHHFPVEEQQPLLPRPFPTPSPTPDYGEQKPPKRLDDLMASFSESEYHTRSENYNRRQNESTNDRYINPTLASEPVPQKVVTPVVTPQPQPHPPPPPPGTNKNPVSEAITVSSPNNKVKDSIAGPPVYYPPGVELFPNRKEEMQMSSMEKGGKGKMKAKRKAKYEYEASSGGKEKSSSGKTVVPVCLPLCCAAPCVIQ